MFRPVSCRRHSPMSARGGVTRAQRAERNPGTGIREHHSPNGAALIRDAWPLVRATPLGFDGGTFPQPRVTRRSLRSRGFTLGWPRIVPSGLERKQIRRTPLDGPGVNTPLRESSRLSIDSLENSRSLTSDTAFPQQYVAATGHGDRPSA